MDILVICLVQLEPVGKFYGNWVLYVVIWFIFPRFGMLYKEKSGNPAV
jgi:hypothetical protein